MLSKNVSFDKKSAWPKRHLDQISLDQKSSSQFIRRKSISYSGKWTHSSFISTDWKMSFGWRHDDQLNDIQQNDTRQNDTWQNNTWQNNTWQNDTRQNGTWQNDSQ